MFKRTLEIMAISSLLASAAWADQKDNMNLKVHANECIQKLTVLALPQYAPDQYLKADYQNDSLVIHFDENHTAEVKGILEKWTEECSDLFDKDVYSPGFFTNSPLMDIVKAESEKQARQRTEAFGNDSLTKIKNEVEEIAGNFSFVFRYGVLESININPRKGKRFQFVNDGTALIWGGNGILHSISRKSALLQEDSIIVHSGYEIKDFVRDGHGFKEFTRPWSQVVTKEEYPSLNESAKNGKFEYDQEAYSAMPWGTVAHNKKIELIGTVGLNIGYLTDNYLEDSKAFRDSSAIIEGLLEMGVNWEVSLGLVRCSATSGTCLGFGAGYGAYVWATAGKEKENRWSYSDDDTEEAETKLIHGVKLFGEYYMKSKTPYGFREAITIPVNESMKYIESKTSLFVDSGINRFELGLAISPIQFIPALFFNIGINFNTNSF